MACSTPHHLTNAARRAGAAWGALLLLSLTQGCALTNVTVNPTDAPPRGIASTVGRGREIALVNSFEDKRSDPERCGMKKNGYNMDTADVICSLPPPRWLADSLARGLTAAGFVVTGSPSPSPTAARLDGDVLQFFVEPAMGVFRGAIEADVSVHLRLTTPTGLAAERTFYFKRCIGSSFALDSDFQDAASRANELAVNGMVAAIVSLLDRYPNAAVPPHTVNGGTSVSLNFTEPL